MSERGMLFVGLSALLTVASNLMLREGVKRAGGFGLSLGRLASDLLSLARQPLLIVGLALYAASALVWFRVISTEKLNSSYPVLVGLTFVLVTLGATVFFHEPISWQKVLGLGLILTGILLVSRG
jgi:multidrug transporter EmrE-like cation transporter